jgi:serine/threonine protein kinase
LATRKLTFSSTQLDYCPGGEVFSYLRRARRFNESTSQFYAAEIVLILEFLHDHQGVAYRDLKPENILIDAEGHLKLVDFGFAKKVENSAYSLSLPTSGLWLVKLSNGFCLWS